MTAQPTVAFVWVWRPGADEPVPAGRLDADGSIITFTYGRRYLDRSDAVALYEPELPLRAGPQAPELGNVAGCVDDAGPDAWGKRVIEYRRGDHTPDRVGCLTYLLESSSDRIGGLDFQSSPYEYAPRALTSTTLEELADAVERLDKGLPLSPELDAALLHGSSVGGARPKVLIDTHVGPAIAKFSSSTDVFPVVKAECVSMVLADKVGLDVASVELTAALGQDVLLVRRFDRPAPRQRRIMISARTMLRLGPLGVGASYADLADLVRERFTDPEATLRELFARIVFNVLVGNTDDHAKNHAAFWDGASLTLTPAYDICAQLRTGGEASQAMAISRDGSNLSQVALCLRSAETYLRSEPEARSIVDQQIAVIHDSWPEACDVARLTTHERDLLWQGPVLNAFALENL
ncbi:MAG: type II toxin-antitoxin system HipA family toxin [Acidimicrobiia bacterium]